VDRIAASIRAAIAEVATAVVGIVGGAVIENERGTDSREM
jgi:hypothetical protein